MDHNRVAGNGDVGIARHTCVEPHLRSRRLRGGGLAFQASTGRATKLFSELSARKSVALSIGTPLYPYGTAHRRAIYYSLECHFSFDVRCVVGVWWVGVRDSGV